MYIPPKKQLLEMIMVTGLMGVALGVLLGAFISNVAIFDTITVVLCCLALSQAFTEIRNRYLTVKKFLP